MRKERVVVKPGEKEEQRRRRRRLLAWKLGTLWKFYSRLEEIVPAYLHPHNNAIHRSTCFFFPGSSVVFCTHATMRSRCRWSIFFWSIFCGVDHSARAEKKIGRRTQEFWQKTLVFKAGSTRWCCSSSSSSSRSIIYPKHSWLRFWYYKEFVRVPGF